jgi:hypothetical protein
MFDWICVVYRHGPKGKASFGFARDLARTMTNKPGVMVMVGETPASAAQLTEFHPNQTQMVRVKRILGCDETVLVETQSYQTGSLPCFPNNSLLIDRVLAPRRCGVPILVPFEETGINSRGTDGPLMIPFGDGLSGVRAGQLALPFAKELKRAVIFYHTSWREPGVTSEDARDHMCETARQNMHTLEAMASAAAVPCTSVIEMTDDTAEGILHCAMRYRAGLLIMSRRLKPGIGCYVTQVLEQSPIPLLIVNHPNERKTS